MPESVAPLINAKIRGGNPRQRHKPLYFFSDGVPVRGSRRRWKTFAGQSLSCEKSSFNFLGDADLPEACEF
jgi:hypothetical protein